MRLGQFGWKFIGEVVDTQCNAKRAGLEPRRDIHRGRGGDPDHARIERVLGCGAIVVESYQPAKQGTLPIGAEIGLLLGLAVFKEIGCPTAEVIGETQIASGRRAASCARRCGSC